MKRKLFDSRSLKQAALAVPAAALMLGASQGAQIGINFQDNWYGTDYAPLTDPAGAFGIPLANWFNAPGVLNSYGNAVSTNAVFSVPSAGDLKVAWSCKNTYSLYANIPGTGDNQVIYGYLDDSDYGYTVTLSGFRGFASGFTIQTIASSDNATAFQEVNLTSKTDTNTVQYPAVYTPDFAGGAWSTSTVSSAFVTLNGNDSVIIKGVARSGTSRSCLAGILIDFTAGNNPPLIETDPQAPTGMLFPGGSFSLNAAASGTPALGYQWRQGGVEILGATTTTYSKSGIAVSDSGNYDVVVTNAYGSVTSAVAVVTVQNVVTPVITQAPVSQSVYQGYPVTFTVAATGGLLTYQWKSNSVVIPDATNTTYTIASVTTNDAGTYAIEVNNPVGPKATASATLTVKVPAGAYEAAIVQTRPALWFRYSDTTAPLQDTAANSGGLAAAGTGLYLGGVSHPVAGNLVGSSDTAAYFNGTSSRVIVPYNASLNTATFSAEAWVRPASIGASKCVLSCGDFASPRAGWLIYMQTTGWNLRFYNQNDIATSLDITGGGAPVAGNLYHLVVTFDGTTATLYVNGVATVGTPTGYVPGTAGPFCVGARADNSFWWNGTADEVAYYSTVLSAVQVAAHYANGTNSTPSPAYNTLVTTDGAVEYLRLGDGAISGKPENAGTLGAAWNGTYSDAGGVLGSPQIGVGEAGPRPATYPGFESNNRSVSLTNGFATAPQLTLGNNVTVTCWIKRQAVSTTGDLSWPAWLGGGGMHLNNGTASNPTAELRYHWNGGNWGWSSGLFVPADVWTFCAMVVEPTKATFYMSDGTTLKSAVNTATHAPMNVTSQPGFGGNQPGSPGRNYIGQLDETTVYDRALTPSEINTLFMAGTGAELRLRVNDGGYIQDTKPTGTLHHGLNFGASCTWVASSTDLATTPVTRTGVEQFTAATPSQITIATNSDFNSASGTIMFWMRVPYDALPGPGSEGSMLVDRRATTGAVIVLTDGGGIYWQGQNGSQNSVAGGYVVDDTWHHVAVTYGQTTSDWISIYVDGALSSSAQVTNAWSWPAAQQIEIGRSHDGYWKRFNGLMDDFRIYSRVLTEAEIASVKNTGDLIDATALKLRYDFGTAGIGKTVNWPFGTLQSSPVLGPSAIWTPVSGATAPNYPFLPTEPALFFRATP